MAFWGTEVKPGKPFTHFFDRVRGRLRISQATLGIGASAKKSLVQCNVGDKSPVFLCALLPDKTESCHLDLEFEEADEVVFSVIGPRSVYLTGYYVGNSRHSNLNDDTDSYGEDIANTDTEKESHPSDEDKYEDSFIDDGDVEVFPLSPISNGRFDEEILDNKKPKDRKGIRKRLKKKYQSVESDDDNNYQQQNIGNGCRDVSGPESEDDDSIPISSLYKSRATAKNVILEAEEMADEETGSKKTEGDGEPERVSTLPSNPLLHSNEVDLEPPTKPKKKRKERSEEEKTHKANSFNHSNALKEGKAKQDEVEANNMDHDLLEDQKPATNRPNLKKRTECAGEGKSLEASSASHNNILKDKAKQDESKVGDMGKDLHEQKEQDHKSFNHKSLEIDSNCIAGEDQSEERKIKKKKKKSKSVENREDVSMDVPLLLAEEKNRSSMEFEDNTSKARTLSSGLIIEELEMGKPDGKVATIGKKVKVSYTGKLRENGQVFDSNIGKDPFRFRLGAEEIIEGWNVGLDGMHVGEKRRLIIPPSMGYGNQGATENVPPNSWLVYDIKLLGVR